MKKDNSCSSCQNHSQSLFCGLPHDQLQFLDRAKMTQTFQSGQALFYAGNPAVGVFCLISGTVKLENLDSSGKSQMVQVFSKGDLLGYRALFSDETYMSSGIAAEAVEACFIPKEAILSLALENPSLSMSLMTQLSKDFRMMESRMLRANSNSAVERIAEALLFLRENFDSKSWTRKEIADWAGTTTETVIRTLAEFEKAGMIEQSGRTIKIIKRLELLARARISI